MPYGEQLRLFAPARRRDAAGAPLRDAELSPGALVAPTGAALGGVAELAAHREDADAPPALAAAAAPAGAWEVRSYARPPPYSDDGAVEFGDVFALRAARADASGGAAGARGGGAAGACLLYTSPSPRD